jgi:hypothetical protein
VWNARGKHSIEKKLKKPNLKNCQFVNIIGSGMRINIFVYQKKHAISAMITVDFLFPAC